MTPNKGQSQPEPGVTTEEQDELTPQLAIQKKPAKADLLYTRNGVVTETSVTTHVHESLLGPTPSGTPTRTPKTTHQQGAQQRRRRQTAHSLPSATPNQHQSHKYTFI
ncbi:hypothetical protein AZE42_09079 [Rhizopogon vesiculosus]|uniref:Uncharacterized protein n=1 Tax=Rhizopogon vesiculosus TaxID=180088 RepID=A0A1J8R053_9AGAM|nr:hypothetical protein AZE42_09079 [Rhizopogon vesiculosus]